MSKESLVLLLGLVIFFLPSLGVPAEWKLYGLSGVGLTLIVVGYLLRRAAYLRRIDRGTLPTTVASIARREAERLSRREAARRFDLEIGPVIRFTYLSGVTPGGSLFSTLHHVSGDGWSTGVLAGDLARLTAAFGAGRPSPLDELPVGVLDFSVWQRSVLEGDLLEESLRHFEQALAGAPTVLDLPTDRPRPLEPSHRGSAWRVPLDPSLAAALQSLASRSGVTCVAPAASATNGTAAATPRSRAASRG